jgi:hypothetical protein
MQDIIIESYDARIIMIGGVSITFPRTLVTKLIVHRQEVHFLPVSQSDRLF